MNVIDGLTEKAVARRTCICGKKIEKGKTHLAFYSRNIWGMKRVNICMSCVGKIYSKHGNAFRERKVKCI